MAENARRAQISAWISRELPFGAELTRAGEVDQEEDGQLALFDVLLDVGMTCAGGHVPVDGADVVAELVFAHLGELHPAALEDGVVLAGQRLVHQPVGADLDPPHLPENLRGQHRAMPGLWNFDGVEHPLDDLLGRILFASGEDGF